MIYTAIPIAFQMGFSASDRRYSSTAVGFPIRNDQKPLVQGLLGKFPSWVGTRAQRIYVQAHGKVGLLAFEPIPQTQTNPHVHLAWPAYTPNERPKNCVTSTAHLHTTPAQIYHSKRSYYPRSTLQRLTISTPNRPDLLPVRLRFTWESLEAA